MGTIWQHAKFKISNFCKIRITQFSSALQFSSQWKASYPTCTTDKVRLINYEIFMKREKTYLTFTFKGRSLSAILNFLLKVRQIATDDLHFIINDDNDDDYVKYTLQLSWFTLPKTRPEPDPEPGLLTITRPEPDPKSKSAIRQALLKTFRP